MRNEISVMKKFIARLKKGDNLAVKQLHDRLYGLLCVFAQKTVRNPETARDIVNDSFLEYSERKSEFNTLGKIERFFYKKVKEDCEKFLKSNERQQECYEELKSQDDGSEIWLEDELLKAEVLRIFHSLIDDLPPVRKSVIQLWLNSVPIKVIATILHIDEQTVRNTKAQAIEALRQAFKKRDLLPIILLVSYKIAAAWHYMTNL